MCLELGPHTPELLSARMRHLLHESNTHDTSFSFENGKQIQVHKCILGSSSDVFHAMFFGKIKEQNNPVKIKDFTYECFQSMIEHIYTGHCTIPSNTVVELMLCAHKYQIKDIEQNCRDVLKEHLDPHNVGPIYEASLLYNLVDLQERCKEFIMFNTNEFLKSSFKDLSKRTVIEFMQSDDVLGGSSEYVIWMGLLDWDKAMGGGEGEASEALKEVLGYVRFHVMSVTELEEVLQQNRVPREYLFDSYRQHALIALGKPVGGGLVKPRSMKHEQVFLEWDINAKHEDINVAGAVASKGKGCQHDNILVRGVIKKKGVVSFKLNETRCYDAFGVISRSVFEVRKEIHNWVWLSHPGAHVKTDVNRRNIQQKRLLAGSIVTIVVDVDKGEVKGYLNGKLFDTYKDIFAPDLCFVATLCGWSSVEIIRTPVLDA